MRGKGNPQTQILFPPVTLKKRMIIRQQTTGMYK